MRARHAGRSGGELEQGEDAGRRSVSKAERLEEVVGRANVDLFPRTKLTSLPRALSPVWCTQPPWWLVLLFALRSMVAKEGPHTFFFFDGISSVRNYSLPPPPLVAPSSSGSKETKLGHGGPQ